MSSKRHAHEPWRIDPEYGEFNIIAGPDDNIVDVAMMQMTEPNGRPDPMRTANGKRILACVNACAGMEDPVEALERVKDILRRIAWSDSNPANVDRAETALAILGAL